SAELVPERAEAAREDLRVQLAGVLEFSLRLGDGIGLQQLLPIEIEPAPPRPRGQDGGDAGLPIDQRAIAIETQRFEVGESQLSNSFRCVQARAPVCPTA